MVFKQKNKECREIQIKVGNDMVNKVEYTKYLDLIVDDKLNWQKHTEHITKKIVPTIGALYRCRDYLNNKNRYLIIYTIHTSVRFSDISYQFELAVLNHYSIKCKPCRIKW